LGFFVFLKGLSWSLDRLSFFDFLWLLAISLSRNSWSWSYSTHFLFDKGPLPSGASPVISLSLRFLLLVTMGEDPWK
jgi:hypothetical protein